eukprot:CAMPEP_0117031726 /NCGR_PEP_ID=MMETSP0472-20121206/22770_1 /TAXON_ID=693140 ORGANISM="Tiarina fusus, Strain LIS" /NCGR_SAMPLE_ID=MMETSP0472 /ASSEMBLY_ACC=CAM_ASM_000603 /LENGTH=178 /DNA_ID=CAMNT_0004740111 /DNA_START=150 /DNA_END=686 /DNA_ORIENTATION=+
MPVTIAPNSTTSFVGTYTPDDIASGNVFVLAARPGADAAGDATNCTNTAYLSDAFTQVPIGCVSVQESNEGDDMDFYCYEIPAFAANATSLYVFAANPTNSSVTYDIYAGFTEGSTGECGSSYVSSSGSSVWLWLFLAFAAVAVLVVIVAGVAGFLYMKKKKQNSADNFDHDGYDDFE